MKRLLAALGAVVVLAGCGADGEPLPPAPKAQPSTGIKVSGTARVGISVSRGGAGPLAPVATAD